MYYLIPSRNINIYSVGAVIFIIFGVFFSTNNAFAQTITLNPSITYQKMTGWEMVAYAGQNTSSAFPNYQDQLFDKAVNEAGINRLRLQIKSGSEKTTDFWSPYQAGTISYANYRCY